MNRKASRIGQPKTMVAGEMLQSGSGLLCSCIIARRNLSVLSVPDAQCWIRVSAWLTWLQPQPDHLTVHYRQRRVYDWPLLLEEIFIWFGYKLGSSITWYLNWCSKPCKIAVKLNHQLMLEEVQEAIEKYQTSQTKDLQRPSSAKDFFSKDFFKQSRQRSCWHSWKGRLGWSTVVAVFASSSCLCDVIGDTRPKDNQSHSIRHCGATLMWWVKCWEYIKTNGWWYYNTILIENDTVWLVQIMMKLPVRYCSIKMMQFVRKSTTECL